MKTKSNHVTIAAIFFTIHSFIQILCLEPIYYFIKANIPFLYSNLIRYIGYIQLDFWSIVPLLLSIAACILLFIKRCDMPLAITFGLTALFSLIHLIDNSDNLDVYIFYLPYLIQILLPLYIALLFFNTAQSNASSSNFHKLLSKLHFIPIVLTLINVLYWPFIYFIPAATRADGYIGYGEIISYYFEDYSFFDYLLTILLDVLFAFGYITLTIGLTKKSNLQAEHTGTNPNVTATTSIHEDGYCRLGKHIALSLFTFGIWPLIWTYRTTRFLNKTPGAEQYNPTSKLLLCLFVPFYQIYWYYKHGQRIDIYAKHKNLNTSDMATMCLIFGIFLPIVSNILMQDRINNICTTAVDVQNTPSAATNTSATVDNVKASTEDLADELRKYKALLDDGLITQEDYDAKKKEIIKL